jgi:glycerol uptake facilitator-like aquaporin
MRLLFHRSSPYHPARYVAELLGTFCLALGVGMTLVGAPVITPLVAALTLGIAVYTLGPVSGAHLNPAVTIGLASVGKITMKQAGLYIAAQVIGGLLAMAAVAYLLQQSPAVTVDTSFRVALGEMFGAFILMMGVMAVVSHKVDAAATGCVIGLSLLLGITFAAAVSNGVLNPAVALSIKSISFYYIIAPVVGAVLAAQLYRWLTK